MVGANFAVTQDVPPYMLINSNDGKVGSINVIGLKRSNMSESVIREIKRAYRMLYLSDQVRTEALEAITEECESPEAQALVQFVKNSKRGIIPHRKEAQELTSTSP